MRSNFAFLMMKLRSPLFYFLLMTVLSLQTKGQLKLTAEFSPDRIGKDDVTYLSFNVENAKEIQRLVPPPLTDFIILSGPNEQSGTSVVNGTYTRFYGIQYVVKPRRTGTITLAPAQALADDRPITSNAAVLKVEKASKLAQQQGTNAFNPFSIFDDPKPEPSYNDNVLKKGEDPTEKIKKNIIVRLETDRNTCYVGEPIVAGYKLYTRLKSESSMIKNPSFNGFSVIDLGQQENLQPRIGKLNGRDYNVYTIRKVQLYPLQPGKLELETAEVENTVHFIRGDQPNRQQAFPEDLFGDMDGLGLDPRVYEDHKATLQSNPLSILVKPLPEAGKPADFKGAVGQFTLDARIEKDQFSTDDAGKLKLIISGQGNLQLITAPEISWPPGIDGFDPKPTDDLDKSSVPVSGQKKIEYAFTANAPGKYQLPPVRFAYFDPKSEKYKVLETAGISFTVVPGTGKPRISAAEKTDASKDSMLNRFFRSRLRVVSAVALLIIIGLIIWLKRDRKKETAMKAESATGLNEILQTTLPVPEITDPLHQSAALLERESSPGFFAALNKELKQYLATKLAVPAEELSRKAISEQLDKNGINNSTSLQLQQLMDELEWQLYTPVSENEKKKEMFERTREMIAMLETDKYNG